MTATASSQRRTWLEPELTPPAASVLAACGDDELLAAILSRRGLTDPARIRSFLDPAHYSPAPPEAIPALADASALLQDSLTRRRILIWGDFDVDGQTSTALLYEALSRLGADVSYYIPRRDSESHGIKVASLEREIAARAPGLLLTCDTGITEYAALDAARRAGVPVIVTDHHEPGPTLPPAHAVVNPKLLPPNHPLSTLPAAGVAFKLIQHVYTSLGRERDAGRFLDLVALGIVGDIALQTDDARYLLQLGLDRLRSTERAGLLALMELARLSPDSLSAEQVGFQLAPRLNAIGRMDDAGLAVELLTTRDRTRALVIAHQMDAMNAERRTITRQVEDAAEDALARDQGLTDHAALVIYQPGWHSGVLGGVASRLAERHGRPVVLLTSPLGADGDDSEAVALGSARAPHGFNVYEALAAQSDLLRTFGGHASAAGLSLAVADIDTLRERLSQTLAGTGAAPESPPLQIDAVLPLAALDETLVRRLARLSPFGAGNPAPVLVTPGVHLSHAGPLGRGGHHRRIVVEDDEERTLALLWWRGAKVSPPEGRFDVAYTLAMNERGELEGTLVDLRETGPYALDPDADAPTRLLEDWRRDPDPLARLEILCAENPGALIWAEAYSRHSRPAWKRRAELSPAPALILYTLPSDPAALQAALETVQPDVVHVIGVQPPIVGIEAHLRQLTLAARNAMEHFGGVVALDVLCGALAGSRAQVRAGLELLAAEGRIQMMWGNELTVHLAPGSGAPDAHSARVALEKLRRAHEEVEAYRRHFRAVPLRRLFPA
ncbi:MAG: single-stranded-DNA-specific exonuclease RecJ [Anaerolineae bacterium]|nr:single-stranded-DNA-specific exonuclease RecJ [Anaerolineae bacterium]